MNSETSLPSHVLLHNAGLYVHTVYWCTQSAYHVLQCIVHDIVWEDSFALGSPGGHLSVVRYLVRFCGFDVKAIDKVGLHCLLLV